MRRKFLRRIKQRLFAEKSGRETVRIQFLRALDKRNGVRGDPLARACKSEAFLGRRLYVYVARRYSDDACEILAHTIDMGRELRGLRDDGCVDVDHSPTV